MELTRRYLMGGAALALALASSERPAHAIVIPVEDLGRWWKMYWMLKDVHDLTQRVGDALKRLQNAAASLGSGNLVDDILLAQRRLTADVRAITYNIETVTSQFESVFPDQDAAKHVAPSDVEPLKQGWDQEIHQSSLAAARAQSAMSTIERNTRSATEILEHSMATTGGTADEGSHLAKLQAVLQMLGVINSDLTTLSTTIATTERVNASVAAGTASDEDLDVAKGERMLRDYGRRETIPALDPRLLEWGAAR